MKSIFTLNENQLTRYNDLSRFTEGNRNNNLSFYLNNVISYTLRRNFEEALGYTRFEKNILNMLASLNTGMRNLLKDLLKIRDRRATDANDPIPKETPLGMAFFPKCLTDFKPANKILNEKLTAEIRRTILKANAADPECPESDKAITIHIYEEDNYLHVYFNKYSAQTLYRLTFLILYHAFDKYIKADSFKNAEEYNLVKLIISGLCLPTESSIDLILTSMLKIFEKRLEHEEENLIEDFSADVQTRLNSNRKSILDRSKNDAEAYYSRALNDLAKYATDLRNANQALLNYQEVDFSAIKTFLEYIKKHPNTKIFKKYNENILSFLMEEPILFTDDKVWSKYIANNNSDTSQNIRSFANNYHNKYNTTAETLYFCTQRLFKEVLIDQKIKIFVSTFMYMDKQNSSFRLDKLELPNTGNFFPHPHLGTNSLTCWGNALTEITKAINNNDGETAFTQLLYACQQMTAEDGAVARILSREMVNSRYHKVTVYQKKGTTERTTFEKILTEFVAEETEKQNNLKEMPF